MEAMSEERQREADEDEEVLKEIEYDRERYALEISRDLKYCVGNYDIWIDRSSALSHFPKTQLVNKHLTYMEAMHALETARERAKDGKWKECLDELIQAVRADHIHYLLGMRSYGGERERKLMATRIMEKRLSERIEEGKLK